MLRSPRAESGDGGGGGGSSGCGFEDARFGGEQRRWIAYSRYLQGGHARLAAREGRSGTARRGGTSRIARHGAAQHAACAVASAGRPACPGTLVVVWAHAVAGPRLIGRGGAHCGASEPLDERCFCCFWEAYQALVRSSRRRSWMAPGTPLPLQPTTPLVPMGRSSSSSRRRRNPPSGASTPR